MLIHIRLSPVILPGALEWIQKSPRYLIGEEIGDKVQTNLHYHVVMESDVGDEAIRARCRTLGKSMGLSVGKGKANAYYGGVKEADDLGFAYAAKHGKITHSAGLTPEEITEYIRQGKARFLTPIVAVSPASVDGDGLKAGTVLVVKQKRQSESMRAKFVRHMEKEHNWTLHDHIHMDDNYIPKCDLMKRYLTRFWQNAFSTIQGAVTMEHAIWMFGDDDVKSDIEERNIRALDKILR